MVGSQPGGKTSCRCRVSFCVAFVSNCAALSGAEGVRGQGLKHKMEVVGHEAEAEKLDGIAGFRVSEQMEECAIVRVFMEDCRAAIATVEDVVDMASDLTAWDARHYS